MANLGPIGTMRQAVAIFAFILGFQLQTLRLMLPLDLNIAQEAALHDVPEWNHIMLAVALR